MEAHLGDVHAAIRDYLDQRLLPFWIERIREPRYGGFRTAYDRDGRPTGETQKTLLCQARTIFTLSFAARLGHHPRVLERIVREGMGFLDRFRDPEHGAYYWIVEEDGRLKDDTKVVYGISFMIYALAEYALLTGDAAARAEAEALFDLLLARAADIRHGGFHEHFDRAFNLAVVRPDGRVHKSLDVHMHLMEAFTTLSELTGRERHRRALRQIIDLIFDRMVAPGTGCGISMFASDWTPIPNQQLKTLWGSDRFDPTGKPPVLTSYGHNIELSWLYLHAEEVLARSGDVADPGLIRARVEPIFRHTAAHGVDPVYGGLYVEGPRDGEATDTDKEFWQQAEAMVGFLDAYLHLGDEAYLVAFRRVHDFVFRHLVHPVLGEWYALAARDGTIQRDYLGHSWKICYHTVRAVCLVAEKLGVIVSRHP